MFHQIRNLYRPLAAFALTAATAVPIAAQDFAVGVQQDPGAGTAIYDFQFNGPPQPPSCLEALDFDDNGVIELTDVVSSLTHQFLGGALPPQPGLENCGVDPTPDRGPGGDIGCQDYPAEACR